MKEKITRWLYGRYGEDALGRFLLGVYMGLFLINLFLKVEWIHMVMLILIVIIMYRILSKNYYARRKENETFLRLSHPWRIRFKVMKLQIRDRSHRYYICPKCKQICRVVRSKKKGIITCPKCYHQFKGRS